MNSRSNAQVLTITLILLLVVGILSVGLLYSWEGIVQIPSLQQSALQAFYLAQSSLELAKAKVLQDVNHSGWWPGPTSNDWDETLMDISGDNYTYRMKYQIGTVGGQPTWRELFGYGQIESLQCPELYRRIIH